MWNKYSRDTDSKLNFIGTAIVIVIIIFTALIAVFLN